MNKIDSIYQKSKVIDIDDNDKYVIMSDVHRGIGNNQDNFLKNKNIFNAALLKYYNDGFNYIELGDGDELWEVKDYKEIVDIHLNTFKILKKYHDNNRLIMIYGNHDIEKKYQETLKHFLYYYKDKELLYNINVYESLILNYKGKKIFLLHGHQADIMSNVSLKVSKFLVKNVWQHLEHLLFKDPTNASKNNQIRKYSQKKFCKWSKKNNVLVITGHTHKAVFPKSGDCLYFNDGCCIHPNGITAIEIENGYISLVRWELDTKDDMSIYVKRSLIEKSIPIKSL